MSELYPKRRKRPEMNLVPLIDVLVILIFFAFVTMQFRSATTLNITVPKVQTSGKNQFSGKVEIGIDNEGASNVNQLHLIDFGISKAYLDNQGSHVPMIRGHR